MQARSTSPSGLESKSLDLSTHSTYCPEGVNLVDYPDCAGAIYEGAWFPINSILLASVIGTIASITLFLVLRRIDINEERNGFMGVENLRLATDNYRRVCCLRAQTQRPVECNRAHGSLSIRCWSLAVS